MGVSSGPDPSGVALRDDEGGLRSNGPFDDVGIWYPSRGATYVVEDILEVQGLMILRTPGSSARVICMYEADENLKPGKGDVVTMGGARITRTLSIPTLHAAAAGADLVIAARRREGR